MSGNILVTGYTGFIGNELVSHFSENLKSRLVGISRNGTFHSSLNKIHKVDLSVETNLFPYFEDIETIVHVAGMVHAGNMVEGSKIVDQMMKVNVDSTVRLAKQALLCGVKRFIFISSIGVNGSISKRAFVEGDIENPYDPYTRSKYMAEQELKALTEDTKMDLVIIRPPLVYGKGATGTFNQLLRICSKKIPLPFAMIDNKRSMIFVKNLVDFIVKCIDHPSAGNQTFLVSDGSDISIERLIKVIREELNIPRLLFPIPKFLLEFLLCSIGKAGMVDRLLGNSQLDSSKARQLLDWTPPYTVEQGIAETVNNFINRNK